MDKNEVSTEDKILVKDGCYTKIYESHIEVNCDSFHNVVKLPKQIPRNDSCNGFIENIGVRLNRPLSNNEAYTICEIYKQMMNNNIKKN